jgi:hypothetical protein
MVEDAALKLREGFIRLAWGSSDHPAVGHTQPNQDPENLRPLKRPPDKGAALILPIF